MNWWIRNQNKISLFISGWCALACITDLAQGNYVWASINGFLSVLNFVLAKT